MPAASALRAEKAIAERSRGAHPCVAQLASLSSRYGTAPAILAESCRMKLCASEPRAPRTLTAKVRSRKRGAPGRWAGMVCDSTKFAARHFQRTTRQTYDTRRYFDKDQLY